MFSRARARPVVLFSGLSVACYAFLARRPDHPLPLSPSRFTQTTLVDSVDASVDTKLLTLSVPPGLVPRGSGVFAPIWSIFIKDSDIQVERPYTPLEGIDEDGHIKLWVKKYEHGEVGRWLHSRRVGDPIDIRGPVQTWSSLWKDGRWDHVLLISGGTGITPFYQLLHSVLREHDASLNTRFTLLHASRSPADLPPSSLMHSLVALAQKHPEKLQLHLFAESADNHSECCSQRIRRGRIDRSAIQDALELTHSPPWWSRLFGSSPHTPFSLERTLVLVCGPEGMVNAIAGPHGRNYSQGEVGGILRDLGFKSHHVWKF